MAKSKFFRVATSGATTDGRTIDAKTLQDMAETYNPATYQARVNLEHYMAMHPESAFGAYGDVLALKTEPVTLNVGGKDEQRLGLYAQIEAMDNLLALHSKNQKLFTSIQVRPNFANSGKAYLDGLAFTDNPASLGTEMIKFCAAAGDASPLHFRKSDHGNIITAAEPVTLEFADQAAPAGAGEPDDDDANSILVILRRALAGFSSQRPAPAAPPAPVIVAPAAAPAADAVVMANFAAIQTALEAFATNSAEQTTRLAQLAADVTALRADLATGQAESTALRTDLTAAQADSAALRAVLEKMPATGFTTRPLANGGGGDNSLKTDC